ncbi:MAG TPA: TetR family transcriptional regulator [Acidimicrobiia bacterium]
MATQPLALQLRAKRSEMMVAELERVALGLFEARGFGDVTVEDIASAAQISVRTFYRYFPTKEDVLQVHIDKRTEALRAALAARPADEPPLQSMRLALAEVLAAEDLDLNRRWIGVVASNASVLQGVLGGIQLKAQPMMAEFFAGRLGLPDDDLVPTILAGAVGGTMQAVQTEWIARGGDLVAAMSDGLQVLERGVGTNPSSWSSAARGAKPHGRKAVRSVRQAGSG